MGSSKLPWGRASLKESGTSCEWDEYVHDLHQMRLKHVRADVKEHMRTPRSLIIHQKMFKTTSAGAVKRSSQQEERYLEIERANRALLNRLSSVMRKPGDVVSMVLAAKSNVHATLNEGFRKKELKRIDYENDKLIHRIEAGGSTYSRKAWAKERNQQEKYLKNLSRYRNGPQATALRVAPNLKGKRKGKRQGRLRVRSSTSIRGENDTSGDFTGFMDWRRQKYKHRRKKKWAKSLPPLESGMENSSSVPVMSFEQSSDIRVGRTTITETSLANPSAILHQSHHGHNNMPSSFPSSSSLSASATLSPQKKLKTKRKAAIQHGQSNTVPDHTKVFETGRSMSGVFAVVSAITRGSSLIIQAFVPEDQTTTEVEVSPAQAKYAMRHVSSDIFRPERREELCRALVAKVEFFFKDSKRMLLFNKTSTAGNETKASLKPSPILPSATTAKSSLSPPPLLEKTGESSIGEEFEDEEDNDEFRALEGVFQLIEGYTIGGSIFKSTWYDAVNRSDRVKTVLRSEILCGYPSLRALRVVSNYQNELNQLVTKTDNRITVGELLLFAQDIAEKIPRNKSTSVKWSAACRLYNRSQRRSGRHVLLSLFNWAFLRVYDMRSGQVFETQLPVSTSLISFCAIL